MQENQESSVVYLIRHAKSAYNTAQDEIKKALKEKGITQNIRDVPQYYQMKFQQNFQDCDIAKIPSTFTQCQVCRLKMKNKELDLIISSPMRRCLQTCNYVFKDHTSNAKVIVDPLFREVMSSRCDIGARLGQSMKDFPQYDYSLIKNPDYWYLHTINNQDFKNVTLDKLSKINEDNRRKIALDLTVEFIKDLYQRRKQNPDAIQESICPILLQKNRIKQLLKTHKKIAIITHNYNIETYIGRKSSNCSILVYKQQYLDLPIDQIPINYI